MPLIAVVGIDPEAEDGGNLDRLLAAHGWPEFPTGQGGHHPRRERGRARFEDFKVFEFSGSIESTRDHHVGIHQAAGQIGAHLLRTEQGFGIRVVGGSRVCVLHDGLSCGGIEINRVDPVSFQQAVEVERTTGA